MNGALREKLLLGAAIVVALNVTIGDAAGAVGGVQEIPIAIPPTNVAANPHGIALTSDGYFIVSTDTNSPSWSKYDLSFNRQQDFFAPLTGNGFGQLRGLAIDPGTGNLFLANFLLGTISEVTSSGASVQQFNASAFPQGVAYDAADNTLFISYFSGLVEHRARTGGLLSSFSAPGRQWTGAAFDPGHNTLLLMDTEDSVYEYTTAGALVGSIWTDDIISGNGQGIAYDTFSGTFFITSDSFPSDIVAILTDPARAVPEPGLTFGGAVLVAALLAGRRRPAEIASACNRR